MKTFLKYLFCQHIWKEESREDLRTERHQMGLISAGLPSYSNYNYYAIHQKCVKCDKLRVVETRIMVI